MIKQVVCGISSISLALVMSNVMAHSDLNHLFKTANGPTLGNISVTGTTGHDGLIEIQGARFLLGSDKLAPCSDLRVVENVDRSEKFKPGIFPITSDDLKETETYLPSAHISCMRIDYLKNGNTYSTGNIIYSWNEVSKEYDSMMPNVVNIELP